MINSLAAASPNQDVEASRLELRARGQRSPFFFQKCVLGFKDMTQDLHGRVAAFMADRYKKRKLLRMSRGLLKTTVGHIGNSLYDGLDYLTDPTHPLHDRSEYPILICMSTATNARLKSQAWGDCFDQSVLIPWLYPEVKKGPEWAKDVRTLDSVDPDGQTLRRLRLEYIGVQGKASSRHFRRLILDDMHAVEVAEESPPDVEDVVRFYRHTDSLLIEPAEDWIDVIGTCASLIPPDVYLTIDEKEGDKFSCLTIRCRDENGVPVWKERFPDHVLESIRKKQGDVLFALNYMLDYIDPSIVEFRSADFKRFRIVQGPEPIYMLDGGKKYHHSSLFPSMTVDLAGWRGTGDKNAIMVMGTAEDDMHLILDSWKRRCDPDTLIHEIIERHKRFQVPVVGVEEVAYQECLSFYLDKAIREQGLYLRVVPVKPHGVNKDVRIRTMQPLQRAGQIAVGENDTLFLDEATRFPRGEKHLLDCYAYQPQIWITPAKERLATTEDHMLKDYLRSLGAA